MGEAKITLDNPWGMCDTLGMDSNHSKGDKVTKYSDSPILATLDVDARYSLHIVQTPEGPRRATFVMQTVAMERSSGSLADATMGFFIPTLDIVGLVNRALVNADMAGDDGANEELGLLLFNLGGF